MAYAAIETRCGVGMAGAACKVGCAESGGGVIDTTFLMAYNAHIFGLVTRGSMTERTGKPCDRAGFVKAVSSGLSPRIHAATKPKASLSQGFSHSGRPAWSIGLWGVACAGIEHRGGYPKGADSSARSSRVRSYMQRPGAKKMQAQAEHTVYGCPGVQVHRSAFVDYRTAQTRPSGKACNRAHIGCLARPAGNLTRLPSEAECLPGFDLVGIFVPAISYASA